ncbi:MAG: HipA N-terminal domain-containing protein [Muribaculaceae bacterium]|nr:HipA N-terminal domain-containing protein [Muribaculaceae bacterium]
MRQANVLYRDIVAGQLVEDDNGYTFTYNEDYLARADAEPISLTFPLTAKPCQSNVLFPFFDGLIPEGWLLDIATLNWKINPNDRMGLLLACCKDCIGAIGIVPRQNEEE